MSDHVVDATRLGEICTVYYIYICVSDEAAPLKRYATFLEHGKMLF